MIPKGLRVFIFWHFLLYDGVGVQERGEKKEKLSSHFLHPFLVLTLDYDPLPKFFPISSYLSIINSTVV